MTSRRRFIPPPVWDDTKLEADRRQAITGFITERTTEGSTRYRAVFAANLERVRALFAATNDLLDFAEGTALAATPSFTRTARYLIPSPFESSVKSRNDADEGGG